MIQKTELLNYFEKFHSVEIIEYESLDLIQIIEKGTDEMMFIQSKTLYCRFQLYLWFMAYKSFYKTLNWKVSYYTLMQYIEMLRITNQKHI